MFDITKLDAQTIIFGGLTLVSLSLVTLVAVVVRAYFKQSQNYYNHTNDVINRNTDAWVQNSSALQKLADIIEQFHKKNETT